jgi:hypothetical protein
MAILVDAYIITIKSITCAFLSKMGQMLSREDEEDELQQQHDLRENAEPRVEDHVERPRQRKRNAAAAIRSRKAKSSGQVRTRRTRATD